MPVKKHPSETPYAKASATKLLFQITTIMFLLIFTIPVRAQTAEDTKYDQVIATLFPSPERRKGDVFRMQIIVQPASDPEYELVLRQGQTSTTLTIRYSNISISRIVSQQEDQEKAKTIQEVLSDVKTRDTFSSVSAAVMLTWQEQFWSALARYGEDRRIKVAKEVETGNKVVQLDGAFMKILYEQDIDVLHIEFQNGKKNPLVEWIDGITAYIPPRRHPQ